MKYPRYFANVAICMTAASSLSMAQARVTSSVESCHATNTQQIENLFEDWNKALQTGDPRQVVALYAEHSWLLPTLSAVPKITYDEKIEYFQQFLALRPVGKIDTNWIDIDCNSAFNTGLYTFSLKDGRKVKARYTFTYRYADNRWKITSHHSSVLPH